MHQLYTSADTSINSSRVPALFRAVAFTPGTVNLDYGGGKYDTATEYLAGQGVHNLIQDPYNRSPEHNAAVVREVIDRGGADTVTCSNVLNVIMEYDVRRHVLEDIRAGLRRGGVAYFTVYEGDGSGRGRVTRCGWQANRKTADYVAEIEQVFPLVWRRGKVIEARVALSLK